MSIISNISGVSFILESVLLTSLHKYFSTKIDKYSIAVSHPLVIRGLFYLYVLINPYIVPGLQ